MKNLCMLTILPAFVLGIFVFSVSGQAADIEGEWINVDLRTRGLTRLSISKQGAGWAIAAWGKCHPKDCVWGSTVLAPLGSSVDDFSLNQGFAIWNAGFATKYVTLEFGNGHLAADVITIFRDRSGRANVRHLDVFQRVEVVTNLPEKKMPYCVRWASESCES